MDVSRSRRRHVAAYGRSSWNSLASSVARQAGRAAARAMDSAAKKRTAVSEDDTHHNAASSTGKVVLGPPRARKVYVQPVLREQMPKQSKFEKKVRKALTTNVGRDVLLGDVWASYTCPPGRQDIFSIETWGLKDMQLASARVAVQNPGQSESQTYQHMVTVDAVVGMLTVLNTGDYTVHVTQYSVIAREDLQATLEKSQTSFDFAKQTPAVGNAVSWTDIGVEPSDSITFNTRWRIINRRRYALDAGQQTRIPIRIGRMRFKPAEIYNPLGPIGALQGRTRNELFVFHGAMGKNPVGDFVNATTAGLAAYFQKRVHINLGDNADELTPPVAFVGRMTTLTAGTDAGVEVAAQDGDGGHYIPDAE